MPYDANLVLRGPVSGTYVDLDSSDSAATAIAQNADGNYVVDLGEHGTPANGMDLVIVQHDQATTYTNFADYVIEDSDHLSDGWQSLLTFPRVYAYMREVIVTATVAFVATDIGLVFTETGNEGIIREFSRKLLTVGGVGKVFVEMQDSGDTYASSGATVVATSGTGQATMVGVGRVPSWVAGVIMVRRFSTPKRYLRLGADAPDGGNFGAVDVLVTGSQHNHVNNLYR